jgi:hypothetical protein
MPRIRHSGFSVAAANIARSAEGALRKKRIVRPLLTDGLQQITQ